MLTRRALSQRTSLRILQLMSDEIADETRTDDSGTDDVGNADTKGCGKDGVFDINRRWTMI